MITNFHWKMYIKINIWILRCVGLWPNANDGYKLNTYTLYSFISLNLFINFHNFFQLINIYFVRSDLEALSAVIYVSLTDLLASVKVWYFVDNIKLLNKLMVISERKLLQPQNIEQKKLFIKSLFVWRRIYIMFWIAVGTTLCLWALFPILDGSYKKYRLPFSAWYPFDTKTSPTYEITYTYQVMCIWFMAIANLNMDTLIAALMMYVGAQCDILSNDLQNLCFLNSNHFKLQLYNFIKHHKFILQ